MEETRVLLCLPLDTTESCPRRFASSRPQTVFREGRRTVGFGTFCLRGQKLYSRHAARELGKTPMDLLFT